MSSPIKICGGKLGKDSLPEQKVCNTVEQEIANGIHRMVTPVRSEQPSTSAAAVRRIPLVPITSPISSEEDWEKSPEWKQPVSKWDTSDDDDDDANSSVKASDRADIFTARMGKPAKRPLEVVDHEHKNR